ncbi:hypothetical protein SAMN05421841_2226 [Chryseobacterium wanjuense]|uniref:Uncharacterized protein n=1 Tax=Chryseobacterium wanjuense TaxID=356305 RepID=A0A1I0QVP0_9FLAO|nr:hypothetical protein SAMN05421841_2226 [Chryseobacterium wanjuense]
MEVGSWGREVYMIMDYELVNIKLKRLREPQPDNTQIYLIFYD